MYIVFEGVVGTGKSTQSKKLTDRLRGQFPNRRVELVREPGGTEIAEAIRTLVQGTEFGEEMHPLTDAYLYASARAQLLHGHIKPLLDEGAIVVSDRNVASSLAYQGYTQGLGLDTVRDINRQAVGDLLPDAILFMDLDVEVGLGRTFDADGDKREKKKADFFVRVAEGYRAMSQMDDFAPMWEYIDAGGSIDEVFERIIGVLDRRGLVSKDVDNG